jgi:hypothetical protein
MTFEYYNADSEPSGISYGKWTVLWWKWALSYPSNKNSVVDQTGEFASENQPENMWFLAGMFTQEDEKKSFPSRKCTIPLGVPILAPVLNSMADPLENLKLQSDLDILKHNEKQATTITKKVFTINGESIPPERVRSDPRIFDVYIHPDFDKSHKGGHTRAASDGYWVCLKPLPEGEYDIQFEGSCEYGRLNCGASYHIKVA